MICYKIKWVKVTLKLQLKYEALVLYLGLFPLLKWM